MKLIFVSTVNQEFMEVNMKMSFLTVIRSTLVAALITTLPTPSSAKPKSKKHPGHGRTIVKAPVLTNTTSQNQPDSASQVQQAEENSCYSCYICHDTEEGKLIACCKNNHLTHLQCITQWAKQSTECGLCREAFSLPISTLEKMKQAFARQLQFINRTNIPVNLLKIAILIGILYYSNLYYANVPQQINLSYNRYPDVKKFNTCIESYRKCPSSNINAINVTLSVLQKGVNGCKKYLNYPNQYCIDNMVKILMDGWESLQARNITTPGLVEKELYTIKPILDELPDLNKMTSFCELINPLQMIKQALTGN